MSRASGTYGRRGRLNDVSAGVRHPATTYGKVRRRTFSAKADGSIDVESESERFVSHLLAIDPRVRTFTPQPFSVDLIRKRLLLTPSAIWTARREYQDRSGPKLYTPDFRIDLLDGSRHVLEVKQEGLEGNDEYLERLERARPILTANGYPLRMVVMPASTDHPLRRNVLALKQAMHRGHAYLTPELIERVTARFEAGPATVRTLCDELSLLPGLIPVLLVNGLLRADVARLVIESDLELSLAYGELSHLCLLEEVER